MRLLKILLNTLFPPVCVSCKREGDFLCLDCLKSLDKKKIRSYHQKYEDPDLHYLDGVIYALDYAKNPQIKAAVKQFKYRFTKEMADYFADLIAEKIGELNMVKNRKIILIPVPLHKKRLSYRGFNQAELIARAVANKLSDSKAETINILDRVRATQQQAKLDKKARHENLKDAFELNKKFVHNFDACVGPQFNWGVRKKGEKEKYNKKKKERKKNNPICFLVDDVFTTGATLENCAQVLKNGGFKKVYGLVVARQYRSRAGTGF